MYDFFDKKRYISQVSKSAGVQTSMNAISV